MPYIVTGRCDKCKYTDCVEVCPVDCFREGENMLYIDPDECIECDACVPACPIEAIFEESEVPERYKNYIEINARMSKETPEITESKDPLPGARTLEQIQAAEAAEGE